MFNGIKQIVGVEDDGGKRALAALEHLLALKQLKSEAYEPVGWTKCGPCGFNKRCWNKAEQNDDVGAIARC